MKSYWFGSSASRWELWVVALSSFALGGGHVWAWLVVLVAGAAVAGLVEAKS